jgi:hypothetical protein
VSERFPLSEIARVHELAEAGKFRGKVILTPDPTWPGGTHPVQTLPSMEAGTR